ncbi:hypothetical protein ACTJKQ_14265 [Acidovorax sp. 22279]|uniref:hypothetical protein n=1 Tax=Acidovorax sp. 22279 TaxID=3453900 RepID=UPI003F850CD6
MTDLIAPAVAATPELDPPMTVTEHGDGSVTVEIGDEKPLHFSAERMATLKKLLALPRMKHTHAFIESDGDASVAIQAALEEINRAWSPAKTPLLVRAKRWLGLLLGFAASLALIAFFALCQAPLLP